MFKFPELPYKHQDLEPYISRQTLEVHHGAHHKGYVDGANKLIEGTPLADKSDLEVVEAAQSADDSGLFNKSAQAWNHAFYWHSMAPSGGGQPKGDLAKLVDKSFGDVSAFHDAFKTCATGVFGSGWAWLVFKDGELAVEGTRNADLPLGGKVHPLICCDVWEHAYYLDYKNKRGDYVSAFLDHLINWDFAAQRLTDVR